MQCAHPIYIKVSNSDERMLPCGKCVMCKRSKALDWSIRLKDELTANNGRAAFITLTYNDLYLPLHVKDKVTPVLLERDMQLFFKRLRKRYADTKIKYYYCGEYGTRTNRPHYHVILFGVNLKDLDIYVLRIKDKKEIYGSRVLDELWPKGEVQVGTVTPRSISYVTGYVMDKILDKRQHKVRPYNRSSQGIGLSMALKRADQLRRNKYINIDGKQVTIPRYYLRKLEIETDTISLKKMLDQYKIEEGYAKSNNLTLQDIIRLARKDNEQREADYKASRDKKSKKSI